MKPETRAVSRCLDLETISNEMSKKLVGQQQVVDQIVNSLGRCIAGMADRERAMLSMLFLGPTGVGKTETVRVLAEVLFGNRRGFTRVNCQEYSAHYNISKLLGSPPGYVGGEIRPLLAQENLDWHFRRARENNRGLVSRLDGIFFKAFPVEEEKALSILLFDEIEKAHPKLWNILLSIIDDGTIVLGNNEEVDFSNTIIICTSNVGSRAICERLGGTSLGFDIGQEIRTFRKDIKKMALSEAERVFPSEWLNRMDEIIAFNALDREDLLKIISILTRRASGRAMECNSPFILEFSDRAKNHIVDSLEHRKWGARPLKRILEHQIINEVSHAVCNGEIKSGCLVYVDVEEGKENFVFQIRHGLGTEDEENVILPLVFSGEACGIILPDNGGHREDKKLKEMESETS